MFKATIIVETRKGQYGQVDVQGRNVSSILDKVIESLETLPEEKDGAKFMDWTRIAVSIER